MTDDAQHHTLTADRKSFYVGSDESQNEMTTGKKPMAINIELPEAIEEKLRSDLGDLSRSRFQDWGAEP